MGLLEEAKGQSGIGALIVFIAMILVAAVAAGVILQTQGNLQNKAQTTGQEALREVSTSVRVTQLMAYTNDSDAGLKEIILSVQISSGSPDIELDDIILKYYSENTYIVGIVWDGTTYTPGTFDRDARNALEVADEAGNDNTFYVIRVSEEDKSDVLELDDIYEIHFWIEDLNGNPHFLQSKDEFEVTILPVAGTATIVGNIAPRAIKDTYNFF